MIQYKRKATIFDSDSEDEELDHRKKARPSKSASPEVDANNGDGSNPPGSEVSDVSVH